MKQIIPSMPFLGFPSDLVLAGFRPVRGLLVETPAPARTPEQERGEFESLADLLDLHDPRPLLTAIAREMGYDPDLLAAGECETGVPGHSWTTYCDESWLPMLVRWQAGDAQLVLSLCETFERGGRPDLRLTILGDAAALPILRRLAVALSPFHLSRPEICQGPVELPGRTGRLAVPEIAFSRFEVGAHICGDAYGRIGATRASELADIARSCNLSGMQAEATGMRADELQLWLRPGMAFTCPSDRPLAPEIIELIQRQSVGEVRRLATAAIVSRLETNLYFGKQPATLFFMMGPQSPAVIAQRLHLAGLLHEIEHLPVDRNGSLSRPFGTCQLAMGEISISPAFRQPEAEVLEGTGHRTYGREGTTGLDLLGLGMLAVEYCLKHLRSGDQHAAALREPPKTGIPVPDFGDLRQLPGSPRARLMPIEKPTFGIHLGLPVRVNLSVAVWRSDDERALAIDFAVVAGGIHLAGMRRCEVPVRSKK
jgi:hypothetical protein